MRDIFPFSFKGIRVMAKSTKIKPNDSIPQQPNGSLPPPTVNVQTNINVQANSGSTEPSNSASNWLSVVKTSLAFIDAIWKSRYRDSFIRSIVLIAVVGTLGGIGLYQWKMKADSAIAKMNEDTAKIKETIKNNEKSTAKLKALTWDDDDPTPRQADPISMEQFFQELESKDSSPFVALKQHLGKRMTWEGYFDGPITPLAFSLNMTSERSYPSISCWFKDDPEGKLLPLRRACKVKVKGILASQHDLRQCEILDYSFPPQNKTN